jgi:hypothetical protein
MYNTPQYLLAEIQDNANMIFANDDPIGQQGTFPCLVLVGEGGFG